MGNGVQKTPSQKTTPWLPLTETQWFRRARRLVRWSAFFLLGCGAAFIIALLVLKSQPLPPPEQPFTTKIYSQNNQLIGELHQGEKREYIPLEQMPDTFVKAVLAVEDRHFYRHFGISPRGILRAVWTDLKAGALVEGGSTITQQLARNLYLNHDRTWTRKLKELKYALQLEIHFTKNELLEMYLNEIYFGHQAYGIKEAAKLYFDKEPHDLTAAECTLLAGIPKGAGRYSPYVNPANAKKRQRAVLTSMVNEGFLTKKEADRLWKEPLHYTKPKQTEAKAPYFRDYVQTVAVQQYGLSREQFEKGGLNIYTTLDPKRQQAAERAIQKHVQAGSGLQAALVSINPKNGHIVAMVGGTDYKASPFNRVLAERQPGSAFKPFLYLAALEHGMTPVSQFKSAPTTFTYGGETYEPQNYNGQYANRPITMREAIARSDNIYAVKTHFHIGREKLAQTAQKLGIDKKFAPYPSLALGSVPVTPLEMAEAYATIARQGDHLPITPVKRIADARGNVLVDVQLEGQQVASPAAAFVLTQLMKGVFEDEGGTGQLIGNMLPFPVAGKTGSTNWDSWLVGFTPDLVTAVWVGYDKNKPLTANESRKAKWIWGTFMGEAASHLSKKDFPTPQGVTTATIDPTSGQLATDGCPSVRREYFVSGTEPKKTCERHTGKIVNTPNDKDDGESRSWFKQLKKWWRGRHDN